MKTAYWATDFDLSVEDRIHAYHESVANDQEFDGFDTAPIRSARYTGHDVATKTVFWEFDVSPFLCNKDRNMHGGAISTMFDNLTSTALYTIGKPGFWGSLGVSRSLIVHFLRGIPNGSKVILKCEVVAAGRKMALVKGTMENPEGLVLATALHEKVWTGQPQL